MFKRLFTAITLLSVSQMVIFAESSKDAAHLTNDIDLWFLSKQKIIKKFPVFSWEKGSKENTYFHKSDGLTLWEEKVHHMDLVEAHGTASELEITIISQDAARAMNKKAFDAQAMAWNKLITDKLASKGKGMATIAYGSIKHSRLAWKHGESVVILSAHYGDLPDRLVLTFYEQDRGLVKLKLKGQQNKVVAALPETQSSKRDEEGEVNSRDLDPKDEKSKIKLTIKEIESRDAPDGVSKKVQDAVNLLNVYRFLSGVPYDVEADGEFTTAAEDAAAICEKNGKLSHDFGHSTDKCNLAMNSRMKAIAESVTQYINDAGANNREKRGHRKWCLNPRMAKTGFGIKGAFSAMYSVDQSSRKGSDNYSYPGHGFYPLEYLHGNGWSYYLSEGSIPEGCEVQLWKLKRFTAESPNWSAEPEGSEIEVVYTSILKKSIVFEPEPSDSAEKGTYLVRLKGDGFKEQYLVHLY